MSYSNERNGNGYSNRAERDRDSDRERSRNYDRNGSRDARNGSRDHNRDHSRDSYDLNQGMRAPRREVSGDYGHHESGNGHHSSRGSYHENDSRSRNEERARGHDNRPSSSKRDAAFVFDHSSGDQAAKRSRQEDGRRRSEDGGREHSDRTSGGGFGHGERGGGRGGRRGGGRGRGGRGGGRGRGRENRRERQEEEFDLVVSRQANQPKHVVVGPGSNLKAVRLQANFFKVRSELNWCLFHYRVDFNPREDDTRLKKKFVRDHAQSLGKYIFDGESLYVSHRLSPDPMVLYSRNEGSEDKIEINIRLVAELAPTDSMYLQIFNIILRRCKEMMGLEEMGRHFYDRHQAISIPAHHLELWPGYKTSMRNHENDILLGVEITHKVLRLDNCLRILDEYHHDRGRAKGKLLGSIVMTTYNRKTYRIDDIDWNKTPLDEFDMRGQKVSFMEYFQQKYNIRIENPRQPMLVSRPKKKDLHRGMTGPIILIPELCQMTGLTDEMRSNFNLMRALAEHLHTDPSKRVEKVLSFMGRLQQSEDIREEFSKWGLKFDSRLVEFDGHQIQKERITFGENQSEEPNDKYDWNNAFRSKPMLSTVPLKTWAVIVPSRNADVVTKLVRSMQRVATPMKFRISEPTDIRRIGDVHANEYAKAVDQLMNDYKEKMEMIFIILPKQGPEIYSAVKKRACLEFGVPSQCFVSKNAYNEKGLMSICTKLVVQMNAKLGGEPWKVSIPLKNLMVVGFDVYHCGKRKGASVGAMVATTCVSQTKYFSTISHHSSRDDLSGNMGPDFTKCLMAYYKINKDLPDRVIMYRDGVGDGMLKYVYETELNKIKEAIEHVYTSHKKESPKFSFIVVTKKINTRIFGSENRGRPSNPEPGTVADDVITLPERYDFYLVSQYSKMGTVSPVSYNVLFDQQGLSADRMQRMTFKLCHMYFNWSGTVTVPAPCQYAKKLAYLTGMSLGGASHERLSNLLYYL